MDACLKFLVVLLDHLDEPIVKMDMGREGQSKVIAFTPNQEMDTAAAKGVVNCCCYCCWLSPRPPPWLAFLSSRPPPPPLLRFLLLLLLLF